MHFRRLEVYQKSIYWVTLSMKIVSQLPRGYGELKDQLRRASISIPLNIAEASGRVKKGDSSRLFAISRGSAMECAALCDICRALNIIEISQLNAADDLLLSIVRMLSKLCK